MEILLQGENKLKPPLPRAIAITGSVFSHIVEPSMELSKALLQLRFDPPSLNFGER